MQKDRPLRNALDESADYEIERDSVERPINEEISMEENEETSEGDVIGVLLRGLIAFFTAIFLSAVVSGLLEAAQGWEITFGSLPMIALTSLLYYPSYKVLKRLGFFRKKSE